MNESLEESFWRAVQKIGALYIGISVVGYAEEVYGMTWSSGQCILIMLGGIYAALLVSEVILGLRALCRRHWST